MPRPFAVLVLAILLAPVPAALGCGCAIDQQTVARAFDPRPELAALAREELREAGPLGLRFVDHQHRDQPLLASESRWEELYDATAQQRGARDSMLYWYTDLAAAEAAARAQRKPIVSLRLLGRLTDEYSCANSRFFRAVLYPDPEVSAWLRERVILHWSTERAAPQVTIDLGDGRVLRTTIGGNSAHFVLDADGRPVDVLPGMYGPKPFLVQLEAAATCVEEIAADPAQREAILARFHREARAATDLAVSDPPAILLPLRILPPAEGDAASAAEALTFSKSRVESPLLDAFGRLDRDAPRPLPARRMMRLVESHRELGALSAVSRGIIARQLAGLRALGAELADDRSAIADIERGIAADSVIAEFALHRTIHERMAGRPGDDFAALDGWLYASVFRTPTSDPFIGLVPRAWDGLPHDERAIAGIAAAR